jgi:imidazolonepropionase
MEAFLKYSLIIENISEIFTGTKSNPVLKGGNLLVAVDDDGIISFVGTKNEFTSFDKEGMLLNCSNIVDAKNRVLYPGFVDSHTHLVFARTREGEFELKAKGATYEEIASFGGGILNSAKKTGETSLDDIIEQSAKRLEQIISYGVTTVEIKSGYALDVEGEIKLLKAIDNLKTMYPIEIVPTFLGAHAYPEKFRNDHDGYIDLIIDEMLPEIKSQNLAQFVDVFCEDGYFSLKETEKILAAAQSMGFGLKLHADEFNALGGTELAAEMGAASVDHLEEITEEGIRKLATSGTVAGVLPVTSVFSRLPFAPAEKMIENGVTVALATDFNPGSSMCGFLPLAASIGATQLKMTVEDSLSGITLNGAKSLLRSDRKGSVEVGKDGDLLIMETGSWIYPLYHFGHNHVAKIFVKGQELDINCRYG